MIKVLYFARLREQLGSAGDQLQASPELADVAAVMRHLQARGGDWADVFGDGQPVLMAVNQEMADLSTRLDDGDEIAFFPPVTGG